MTDYRNPVTVAQGPVLPREAVSIQLTPVDGALNVTMESRDGRFLTGLLVTLTDGYELVNYRERRIDGNTRIEMTLRP